MIKFISSWIGLFSFFFMVLNAESVDSTVSSLKKINDYIHKCPLAVISTIDTFNNGSQSALIAFTENDELELYF